MRDVDKLNKIFGKTKEEALKNIDEKTELGHGIKMEDQILCYLIDELNKINREIAETKYKTGNDNTFMFKDIIEWLEEKITFIEKDVKNKKRKEILSKLTYEEKQILGLED